MPREARETKTVAIAPTVEQQTPPIPEPMRQATEETPSHEDEFVLVGEEAEPGSDEYADSDELDAMLQDGETTLGADLRGRRT